jgi:N-methylhydantoinase B
MTPGGGGYGNPFERDVEAVLSDVLRGVISNQKAKQSYGVVIDGVTVDLEKTTELRRQSSIAINEIFSFGSERDCWESHFGDAEMAELIVALDRFEPRERHRKRREFFEKTFPEFCEKKVEILKLAMDVGGKRRMDAMQWLVSSIEKSIY